MTIGYIISLIFAIGLLIAYLIMVKNKEIWLTMLYVCVTVVNLGYTILSSAKTLEIALLGNDVAYLGSVFLSTCMFLTIVRLCGFKITKLHTIICLSLGIAMFAIVATSGFLPWYYKSAEIEMIDGSAKLVKEYGPLHNLYLVYLIGYFAAMIATIIHSVAKKKIGNPKFAGLIAGVVCGNIITWLFEKFVSWDYEMLSVTYILSEIVLLLVYWMMQDYVHKNDIPSSIEEKTPVIIVDTMSRAEKIEAILATLPEGVTLSARQIDMLEGIIDGKSRKEIAADLHLSENTVKMHTSALYRALDVSSREEIHALLKI